MTADDAETFAEPVSTTRVQAYFMALAAYDIDSVCAAMHAALKVCRFFPRPAELLDLIGGDLEDRAVFAWTQLRLKLARRPCAWDEAAERTVALMGGWRALDWLTFRDCTRVEEATMRKEFLQLYRVAAKRGEPRYRLPGTAQIALPAP